MKKKSVSRLTAHEGFTPGPWTVVEGKSENREMSRIIKTTTGEYEPMLIGYVLRDWANGQQQEEDNGNARLISAAPELLAVVLERFNGITSEEEWAKKAQAAIRKAEGRKS